MLMGVSCYAYIASNIRCENDAVLKTRSFVSKTRDFDTKKRDFLLRMMNFAFILH